MPICSPALREGLRELGYVDGVTGKTPKGRDEAEELRVPFALYDISRRSLALASLICAVWWNSIPSARHSASYCSRLCALMAA